MSEHPNTPPPGPVEDEELRWREFGHQVERLRIQRGYTTTRLASDAGVAFQSVVTIERGGGRQTAGGEWVTPNPKDETLAALARVLGANVEDWFTQVGRYDERPRTRRSLRRGAGRRDTADRLAQLEERVEELESLLDEVRGSPGNTAGKGRRRAPG